VPAEEGTDEARAEANVGCAGVEENSADSHEVVQRDVVQPVTAELDRARAVAGALGVARR
jgi:hypothetical protein